MKWTRINLTIEEQKELNIEESRVKNPHLLKRLQCVKLKDMGWKNKDLANFFNVCIETITHWLKAYESNGIEGLLKWENKGRPSTLTVEQIEILKERNKEKPFENANEAKDFIEQNFGHAFHLHHVQKLLKKNLICRTKRPG